MADPKRCPRCDAELAADSPDGLCPACLLVEGMRSEDPAATRNREQLLTIDDARSNGWLPAVLRPRDVQVALQLFPPTDKIGAGALGNITNVLIQHPSHRAVGASTAVFAALGLLTAYTWMHRRDTRYRLAYRSAPLVSGLVLLAYFGTGDARTDIVAHLTGFAWGLAGGLAAGHWPAISRFAAERQVQLGLATLATILLAWTLRLA